MHEGHRSRLRERAIAQGIDSLETHELLELFLFAYIPRKDTNSIAHELLEKFGSLSAVFDAEVEDLLTVLNMTKQAALALSSIPYMLKLYSKGRKQSRINLSSISSVVAYMKGEMEYLTKERMSILCLDTHFNLIHNAVIKSESVDRVNISIKDIHSVVLRHRAKNIIIVHNHPSGSILPSDDDISVTKDIIMSMSYLDVEVLDHIIITDKDYFSFRERGVLSELMPKSDKVNNRYAAEKNNIGVRSDD